MAKDGISEVSHHNTHTGTYLAGDEVDVPSDHEHGGQAEEHDEQLGEEERVGLQHGRGLGGEVQPLEGIGAGERSHGWRFGGVFAWGSYIRYITFLGGVSWSFCFRVVGRLRWRVGEEFGTTVRKRTNSRPRTLVGADK